MNYQEATDYLFSQTANYEKQGTTGYKPGLGNMLALDQRLGHPHRAFRSIHVAGTNGKGSVSHTLAAFLQLCGYKVGLYTSPHLVDFSERIRVNGQPIGEEYVTHFVEQHRAFCEDLGASFFEIATAMAFRFFADEGIDVAVIEVGLGGRLDSTNIITPELCVITNISLDHTQLLGGTVQLIAAEKAGIMKKGVPCVVGEATPEVRQVFIDAANEKEAPLCIASDDNLLAEAAPLPDGSAIHYRTTGGLEFDGCLTGTFQQKNTNTLLHVFGQLAARTTLLAHLTQGDLDRLAASAFANVVKLTGLQGRWQQVRQAPAVVCDMGHNPGAWAHLSQQLKAVRCHELHIVYGALQDKDISTVMAMLPTDARYYWTKGRTGRACPETTLQAMGDQLGLKGEAYSDAETACQAAISAAQSDDFVFVGGSAYVVAEFLRCMRAHDI